MQKTPGTTELDQDRAHNKVNEITAITAACEKIYQNRERLAAAQVKEAAIQRELQACGAAHR